MNCNGSQKLTLFYYGLIGLNNPLISIILAFKWLNFLYPHAVCFICLITLLIPSTIPFEYSQSNELIIYNHNCLLINRQLWLYIINSFDCEYSNGIVEGINNVIKQIKHTACGYKKFNHLKARIMLIKGLFNPINP